MKADIVIGIDKGDEGKAKITSHLLDKNKYNICMRYNGSANAGHTVVINGKKIITHTLPGGVLHGVKSIIGCGCVLNVKKFFEEIEYIEDNGFDCRELILISNATHIITDEHVVEDSRDEKIGTTKSGNGPAYRDKYNRTGVRAEDINELQPFIIDLYEELFSRDKTILCEGAQAFGLDIDWGNYPYCTSSHCNVGGAILNGIPYNCIRDVYGVCKSYTTYVGSLNFQPEGEVFERIQQVGKEYGATTGRKRKINYLDFDLIKKAININGVNILVVNKMDILREVGVWNLYKNKKLIELKTEDNFKSFLKENIKDVEIIFSYRPDGI